MSRGASINGCATPCALRPLGGSAGGGHPHLKAKPFDHICSPALDIVRLLSALFPRDPRGLGLGGLEGNLVDPLLAMRPLHGAPAHVPGAPGAAEQPADRPSASAAPGHSPSRPLPGSVAKLACLFEGQTQQQQQQQPATGSSPASASALAAARTKRQRVGGPPLPEEWLQSPPLANGGSGEAAAEGAAPVERELFEGEEEGGEQGAGGGAADAAAARAARLQAIRARCGSIVYSMCLPGGHG